MTQDLRTTPRDGTIPARNAVTIDMGLRHHLNDYVSQEEGDGKPTAYRIAKDANISLNTVYRICGSPEQSMSWEVIAKLCGTLGIQPGELLSFDTDGD